MLFNADHDYDDYDDYDDHDEFLLKLINAYHDHGDCHDYEDCHDYDDHDDYHADNTDQAPCIG